MKRITLQIYKDRNKKFRYRFVHRNGNILLSSSESYENRRTMNRVFNNIIYDIITYNYNTIDQTKK